MAGNKVPKGDPKVVAKKMTKVKNIVLNRARNARNSVNMDPKLLGDTAERQSITKYTKA